jgi:V-type H+-transporting ATPase subunit E
MTFAEDEGRYSQFLEGAIVQEFLRLMEPNVTLTAREKDVERVHKAAETGS